MAEENKVENIENMNEEPNEENKEKIEEILETGTNFTTVKAEEKETKAVQTPKNIKDDPTGNRNEIYLRGVIRGIRMELDEEDRPHNVITLTTPRTERDGTVTKSMVDITLGRNDRATELLNPQFVPGDHVIIHAELRVYRGEKRLRQYLWANTIEKDRPDGLSGLGVFEPDKNEGLFIGTVHRCEERTTAKSQRPYMYLLQIATHTKTSEGKELFTNPFIGVHANVYRALKRNADKFAPGKKVGVACNFNMVQPRDVGNTHEINMYWEAFGLMYVDDNGELQNIPVPKYYHYRAPANVGNNRTYNQDVKSTVEEDMKHLIRGQEEEPEENEPASRPTSAVERIQKETDYIEFGKPEERKELEASVREQMRAQILGEKPAE